MSAHAPAARLPRWMEYGLLPVLNLVLALLVSGLVVVVIGQDPFEALGVLLKGAFGSIENIGYTLYYATDIIFTGLAVAVAFQAGLFNIGGEGQAYIAGLGVGLVCLYLDFLPMPVIIALAVIASMVFGAAWAAIPAWLQAHRGSHIVITTIMFNFIAYSVMVYLLVHPLIEPGQMAPQSRAFAANAIMPSIKGVAAVVGLDLGAAPLNLSFVWALIAAAGTWLFIGHTSPGYAIRVVGANPEAAVCAGIRPERAIMLAMLLSGALAGGLALNEVMGVQQRIMVGFTAGYGFTGIAAALMGRNHPVGIILAALLFGALYQGGAELSFDIPDISAEMVVVIQGFVIIFTGALENMLRPTLARLAARLEGGRAQTA
ncbi:MAG: ABC transporter permease [Azospirillaceae bacterium]|nr:ABC transporter permease [Azospirillaceae bacterium]